ncbi:MAG: DUF1275 domain-containing protein [Paraburkholderia sp.]|nr:DUF1275 domain-containing protein [Paraburkholderia sp.]
MSVTGTDSHSHATLGLALLSFAAGSMDAIAFFALGGVFTSAMSGNTIVLGIGIGQGHFNTALHSFTAILGYVAGVGISSLSFAKFGRGSGWTLGVEVLFLAAFVALWIFAGTPASSLAMYSLISISAIAMGLQGGIARAIGVSGIMTVIFTSTYTVLASNFVERALAGDRPLLTVMAVRRLAALAAYLGGAVIAAIIVEHWRSFLPFPPFIAILVVFVGLKLRLITFDQNSA